VVKDESQINFEEDIDDREPSFATKRDDELTQRLSETL
jgi:hypothetical protein